MSEELQEKIVEAERKIIIAELERRDQAAGVHIVDPPHCDECFEGCEKCNWGRK